ncbi:MAG TPA: hypothetical protein VE978_20290 [Chitinophagales bacterium]|nr:hypothetical protein [Chitinophagales bacterium]
MKRNFLIALITMISLGYSAFAQKVAVQTNDQPGWHKIAQTTADLKKDRDEVIVVGKDHYQAIRLKVTDVPVEILNFVVYYENDTKQDISVRSVIKAGEDTRVIDLDGKDRAIKKIVLMYKSVPNAAHDKAVIEIWGRK